jgi:hypothetical protein
MFSDSGGTGRGLQGVPRRGQQIEYVIGLILAVAVAGSATVVGFDRERAFYPTVLIVIASYYVLFAAMGVPAAP